MPARILFFLLAACCFTTLFPIPQEVLALVAPGALIAGIVLALTIKNPFPAESKKYSRTLLQASVILLGFSLDLNAILKAGADGIMFALISISVVFLLGYGFQKLLQVRPATSLLVSTGTAICGGSAIAAMSTVIDAPQEDVSVAVGTVFLLNAVALIIFPPIGHALKLTDAQFGVWSGIAIHDVSSVVGAATAYGGKALETATAVKLSRVLYLIPITLIASYFVRKATSNEAGAKPQIPWFIAGFLAASLARTYVPAIADQSPHIKQLATGGFALSLFLIGAGISVKTLKSVGVRPLLQGIGLWTFMAVSALLAVRQL